MVQEGRLQASKKRWKHGGGREQPRRKIYRQARRDADIEKPKRKNTGKQGEMEIWWRRRATKKGDCRKAKSDKNIKKQKRETTGKQGEM